MTGGPVDSSSAPMEPGGAYNRSSQVQSAGLSHALPLIEDAARTVRIAEDRRPLVIADYGASQGRNSLAPIRAAIRALRARAGAARPIVVAHTDRPSNDFSALFETLENDPDSYLRDDPAVFATAVGRSFYGQILPSDSVALGWSSWAVQWLSRTPCAIGDQLQIAYSANHAAKTAFANQAAEDWRNFVACRAAELQGGGKLVVVTMATTDEGDFGYRDLVLAMYGALGDLVSAGVVSDAEMRQMVIPTYGRTRTELLAPFESKDPAMAGLSVERLDVYLSQDWIWEAYLEDRDAARFGARWAAFNRASVFPTLACALDSGGGEKRAADFCDSLEHAIAARLAANPTPTIIPLARMTIARV